MKNGIKKYVHQWVWMQYYNCQIPKGYVIHHIDENYQNNWIGNLVCITDYQHKCIHNKGSKHPMYGKPGTMLGKTLSIETKNKMSQSAKLRWRNKL